MPGRLFLTGPLAALPGHAAPPEVIPRANIAPGEMLECLAPDGWRMMRWGLIPQGRTNARGRPVMETLVNARSETVFDKQAFAGLGRCVVPAGGWYEWTGAPRRKQAWRLAPTTGLALFAAVFDIWRAPGGQEVAQVAMLTCAPNADVAPIHDRMGVLLTPEDVPAWLSDDEARARAAIRPWPLGALTIARCPDPGA